MTELAREAWLVRHGVTASNRDRLVQGSTDVPLAEDGIEQARALAESLARRQIAFGLLVSSPLSRARHTAELLAARLGLDVEHDPALAEASYGAWEGHSFEVVLEGRRRTGGEPFECVPPGGESVQQMGERVTGALRRWLDEPRAAPRLLVVTHGGPIGAVVCDVLGVAHTAATVRRFRRDNTGVTVLRRRSSDGSLQLAALNATDHLPD